MPESDPAAAEGLYIDSCKDLLGAILSLEASLGSFASNKDGCTHEPIKTFARTKARLEDDLSRDPPKVWAGRGS